MITGLMVNIDNNEILQHLESAKELFIEMEKDVLFEDDDIIERSLVDYLNSLLIFNQSLIRIAKE